MLGRCLLLTAVFFAACSAANSLQTPVQFTAPAQFLVDKETDLAAIVKVKRVENRWMILEDGDHFPFLLVDCEMEEPLVGAGSWAIGTTQTVFQDDYSDMIFEPLSPPALEGRSYILWATSTKEDKEAAANASWIAHPQGFLRIRGDNEKPFIYWNGKSYSLNDIRKTIKSGLRLPLDQIIDPAQRLKVAEGRMKDGNLGDETAFVHGLLVNVLDPEGQAKNVQHAHTGGGSTDLFGMDAGDKQPHAIWYGSLAMLRDLGKQEKYMKDVLTAITPVSQASRDRIRLAAALALADLGSDAGKQALIHGYEVDSGEVSGDPPDDMTFPGRYMHDESSVTACAYALARLGDHRGLKHKKPEVRLAAADALKDSGDPEVLQTLKQLANELEPELEKAKTSGELSKPRDPGDYTTRYPDNWIRTRMFLARAGDNESLRQLVEAFVLDFGTYPKEEPSLVPIGRGVISSNGATLRGAIETSDSSLTRLMERLHLLFEKDPRWDQPALKALLTSLENPPREEDNPAATPKPDEAEIARRLADPDARKRAEALAAAGYFQMKSFFGKLLETALKGSGEERAAAIYGLGFYEIDVPESALKQLLSDKNDSIQMSAVELATRKNPDRFAKETMEIARTTIKKSEADKSGDKEQLLSYLPRLLCRQTRRSLPPALTDGLKDADPLLRRTVVIALQLGGNPESIPHLTPLLNDSDPSVREAARVALEWLGPEQ